MWNEIIYPFLNLQAANIEFCEQRKFYLVLYWLFIHTGIQANPLTLTGSQLFDTSACYVIAYAISNTAFRDISGCNALNKFHI